MKTKQKTRTRVISGGEEERKKEQQKKEAKQDEIANKERFQRKNLIKLIKKEGKETRKLHDEINKREFKYTKRTYRLKI